MIKINVKSNLRVIFIIAAIAVVALIPLFTQSPYYLDLFITVMVNAVLGMMFIMGLRVGLINMGIIAFWGVGAYASAILATHYHISVWICIPAAAVITAIVALGVGAILMKNQNAGMSFIVLTIIIGMLFNIVAGNISFMGGWNGISNIPAPNPIHLPFLPPIEFVSKIEFFYLGLFIFLIIILISYGFYASSVGRAWRAIGISPRLAESLGVDLFRYKLLAFVLSGALCGLIGAFYAHYQAYISPDYFGMWLNIYVQIYVILGGSAFAFLGPIVGSAVMTFVPEFLRIAKEVTPVFTGLLLIILVLFFPEGLLGLVKYGYSFNKTINKLSSLFKRKVRKYDIAD